MNARRILQIIAEGVEKGETVSEINNYIRRASGGRYSFRIHDRNSSTPHTGFTKTKPSELRHKDENNRAKVLKDRQFRAYQYALDIEGLGEDFTKKFHEAMRTMGKIEVRICDNCKREIKTGQELTVRLMDYPYPGTAKDYDSCSPQCSSTLIANHRSRLGINRRMFVVVSKHGEWAKGFSSIEAARQEIHAKAGVSPYSFLGERISYGAKREIWQRADGHQYYIYPLETK